MPLDSTERAILDSAAEALTANPAAEGAAAAVAPIISRLSPSDRLQLRVLLRALELAPLASRHLSRFTRLTPSDRLRYLEEWAESRLPLRRRSYAALRTLAMIGHYGRDAAWPEVGYRGPWLGRRSVRVLPAPKLGAGGEAADAPGVRSARDLGRNGDLSAQVCVIGTGAGGAAVLSRLAEAGVDVLALEAGGSPRAADFSQRELEMLPLLYREGALRATADKSIGILQGEGVGGSTLHNTGLVYEPPTAVLERWRDEHGFALGPDAMEEYVAEVLGVLHAKQIPADRINRNNQILSLGAEALGWRYRVALHNREICSECGYCMLGCAYNRKYNSALTYIPRAIAAGARILSNAQAVRIRGRSGAREVDVRVSGPGSGARRITVRSSVVVLAAGALDSPALLLRSGLGGAQVGRKLRLHPAAMVAATMPEPVIAWRGLPQSVVVEEFARFLVDGYGGYLVIPSASNWPGLAAVQSPGSGLEHRARMLDLPRTAAAVVLLHDETEGQVSSSRGGRPIARYWPQPPDAESLRTGIGELARLYLSAGASAVHLPQARLKPVPGEGELRSELRRLRIEPHRVLLNSVHPQGSLALGPDRNSSATNPDGELWEERGIFVADASLFPTSVGVPPQVTTMALATMVADRIRDRLRAITDGGS